jgi:prepilin-type N-terminal cleavage/methylation domain-containing protein
MMKQHSKKQIREKQRGFTITEVIVVAVVFSLTVVAIAGLFASIQSTQRSSIYLDAATQAARAQIETIRTSKIGMLVVATPPIPTQPPFPVDFVAELPADSPLPLPPNRRASYLVTVAPNAPNSYKIDVAVGYRVGILWKDSVVTAYVDKP